MFVEKKGLFHRTPVISKAKEGENPKETYNDPNNLDPKNLKFR